MYLAYPHVPILRKKAPVIVYSRVSQPVGHGRILIGSRPGITDIEYVLQVEPFNENADSSRAAYDITCFLSPSLCVGNYCDTNIST